MKKKDTVTNHYQFNSPELPHLIAHTSRHQGDFVVEELHLESSGQSLSEARQGMDYLIKRFKGRDK